MTVSGKKIIDGLKDAAAGNFSRVHVEGQTYVRADSFDQVLTALKECIEVLDSEAASAFLSFFHSLKVKKNERI